MIGVHRGDHDAVVQLSCESYCTPVALLCSTVVERQLQTMMHPWCIIVL
jgi:hypothetical protein